MESKKTKMSPKTRKIWFWIFAVVCTFGAIYLYYLPLAGISMKFSAFMGGLTGGVAYFSLAFALMETFPKFKAWMETH